MWHTTLSLARRLKWKLLRATEKGLHRGAQVCAQIALGCKSCAAAFNVFSSFLSFFQHSTCTVGTRRSFAFASLNNIWTWKENDAHIKGNAHPKGASSRRRRRCLELLFYLYRKTFYCIAPRRWCLITSFQSASCFTESEGRIVRCVCRLKRNLPASITQPFDDWAPVL
jgi:hypothetical protein